MKTGKIKAPVGKGFLIIDQRIFKDLRGKWLILSISAKNGPRKDNMCQLTYSPR